MVAASDTNKKPNVRVRKPNEAVGFLMPSGYVQKKEGGKTCFYKEGSERKYDKVICQDFAVLYGGLDRAGRKSILVIEFQSKFGRSSKLSFDRGRFYTSEKQVLAELAGAGFDIRDAKETLKFLDRITPQDTNVEFVTKPGWHGNAFMFPDGSTLSNESGPRPVMLDSLAPESWCAGNVDGWKAAVENIFDNDAKGVETLAFGVIAGGAGAIVNRHFPDKALTINLCGETTSGKTTALRLAASASGAPSKEGNLLSLKATANSLEERIEERAGTTIPLDEGMLMGAADLSSLIWSADAGQGKGRAYADSTSRPIRSFSALLLFSNETPIGDKLRAENVPTPPGMDVRLLDVDVSGVQRLAGQQKERVLGPLEGIREHYGHAARAVVSEMLRIGFECTERRLSDWSKKIALFDIGKSADEIALSERRARGLAAIALAGELMQEVNMVPPFDIERIIRWAWGRRQERARKTPMEAAIDNLREKLTVCCLEGSIVSSDADFETINRKGLHGVIYREFGYIAVFSESIQKIAGTTLRKEDIAKSLKEKGFLMTSRDGENAHRYAPKAGNISHYRIKIEFIDEEYMGNYMTAIDAGGARSQGLANRGAHSGITLN